MFRSSASVGGKLAEAATAGRFAGMLTKACQARSGRPWASVEKDVQAGDRAEQSDAAQNSFQQRQHGIEARGHKQRRRSDLRQEKELAGARRRLAQPAAVAIQGAARKEKEAEGYEPERKNGLPFHGKRSLWTHS